MTEAKARADLAAFDGLGGLERWIAALRPWQAIPTGWTVPGELQGWRFKVEAGARRGPRHRVYGQGRAGPHCR